MEVIVNEHEASPQGELVYDRSAPSGELSDKVKESMGMTGFIFYMRPG